MTPTRELPSLRGLLRPYSPPLPAMVKPEAENVPKGLNGPHCASLSLSLLLFQAGRGRVHSQAWGRIV